MTGTGNVIDKTLAQWRALQLKPYVAGGKTMRPLELSEVFNEFGGKVVIVIEPKTEAVFLPLLAEIERRGLQRGVLVNSSGYAHALECVSRGIAYAYISDTAVPATLAADGVEWVWPTQAGSTQTYIESMVAAGIKVISIVNNGDPTIAANHVTWGASMVAADDPWFASQTYTKADADPFATKLKWGGAGIIGSNERFARLDEYGLGVEGAAGVSGGIAHRWAGKRGNSVRVRWRVRFAPTSTTDLTKWVSMALVRTATNQPFSNAPLAGTSQDGYHS